MTKQTRRNLILDGALALAFVASLKPFVTGLAVHEWLGLGIGAGIATHTLLHRRWIGGVGRLLMCALTGRTRLCFVLDAALLLAFGFLIVSGLAISQAVLPWLGLHPTPSLTLATAHRLSAYATLGLLAIKLALHGRWIQNALRPRRRSTPVAARGARVSRRRLLAAGGGALCALALLGWSARRAARAPEQPDVAGEPATPPELAPQSTSVTAPEPTAGSRQTAAAPDLATATVPPVAPVATAAPTLAPTEQPLARTRCPYGLVNDPYPGRCRRYVDSDGSGYCDLSEVA
jgi:hypothetical protein